MNSSGELGNGDVKTRVQEPKGTPFDSTGPRSSLEFLASKFDRYLVLLTVLSLFALGPLFQPGYFWGAHDARHSVYFLFEFDRVLSDGEWYPRWMPDQAYGYGYPFWNIYAPGAYYAGEFIHLAGFDLVSSVKIMFGLSFLLSGLTMYGFVKRVFNSRQAAFVAGLAYVFHPYHLVDVYVRANLAESVALIFLPLSLWAFYETIQSPNRKSVILAGFSYAALVFAHNGIALLFSPALGAWILFLMLRTNVRRGGSRGITFNSSHFLRAAVGPGFAIVLGLALVAVFFIPLSLEFRDVNTSQWNASYYSFADHFVEAFQLFNPTWGFGISVPGPHDGLSFQLGLVPSSLALLAFVVIVRNQRGLRGTMLFFASIALVIIVLMLEPTRPIWERLNLVSFAQFPWRLLGLVMVFLSVLAGSLLTDEDEPPDQKFAFAPLFIGVLVLLGSYPYITAQNVIQAKEGPVGLASLMTFELNANELTGSTRWVKEQPTWSPLADNFVAGKRVRSKVDLSTLPPDVFIGQTKDGFKTTGERIAVNSPHDFDLTYYIAYYPGWRAYLLKPRTDEVIHELEISTVDPYGQIRVRVPAGEYFVLLTFQDTPPRTIGKIVSALAILFAVGALLSGSVRRRK